MNSPVLDIFCEWNHTWHFVSASFTYCNVFKVHSCCSMCQHLSPSLRLSNSSLYGCTTFHSHIHQLMDNCVSIVWIVSNSCHYEYVYKCLCRHNVLYSLGSGVTAPCGDSMFNFWRTAGLLSKVAAPFCIPTGGVWGFQFACLLADTYYCLSSGSLPT